MTLFNRCKFVSTSSGTAAFGVGSAVTGFRTPAASGALDGAPVSYTAESGSQTEWEYGHGVYHSAGPTVSRDTVLGSSNSGSTVNFANPPTIWLDVLAEDIVTNAGVSDGVFENTGAVNPWYGNAVFPNSFYDSTTDMSWFVWEGIDAGTTDRKFRVTTFDHTTHVWSPQFVAGVDPLVGDDHGNAAILRDASGYVHLFGGSHNAPMRHLYTTTPDDPSAWTLQGTFGTALTYAHPVLIGSTIYLFARETGAGVQSSLSLYKSTSITAGAITFASVVNVVDFGSPDRVDPGSQEVSGNLIYLTMNHPDQNDSRRLHVYVVIYDTATGGVSNVDGTKVIASGALPVTTSDMNRYFLVGSAWNTDFSTPSCCFDTSGNFHVLYSNTWPADDTFQVWHTVWNGSAWSSSYLLAQSPVGTGGITCLPLLSGGIRVVYGYPPNGAASDYDIFTTTRVAGSTAVSTLNADLIGAGTTISNGNLTVLNTAGGLDQGAPSLASASGGKYYCEFTIGAFTGTYGVAVGVGNVLAVKFDHSSTSSFLGGVDNNGIGYFDAGDVILNNVTIATYPSFTTGDVISMAVDINNRTLWFRKNNGNWNNSAPANPATNTGGLNISIITVPYFAWIDVANANSAATVNFGTTAYAQSVPSGFGNWLSGGGTWSTPEMIQEHGENNVVANPIRVWNGRPELEVIWSEGPVVPDVATPYGTLRGWAWGESGYVIGARTESAGEAAPPLHAIQFNEPFATLAGDSNLLWMPGMLVNSNTAAVTPPTASFDGVVNYAHSAFGDYGIIDRSTFAASDPVNAGTYAAGTAQAAVVVSELFTGNLAPFTNGSQGQTVYTSFRHTGGSTAGFVGGMDVETAINSNSTGNFGSIGGTSVGLYNYGSGNITTCDAVSAVAFHDGGGTVGELDGLTALSEHTGAGTVTAARGVNFQARLRAGSTATQVLGLYGLALQTGGTSTDALGGLIGISLSGGTVTNASGIKIDTPVGGATITNLRNLHVADASGVTTTNGPGTNIYSAGTASVNTFDGNVITGGLGQSLLTTTSMILSRSETIAASYCAIVATPYEISSGIALTLAADAVLQII